MKVQLIANLSANGELILAAQSDAYQAPQEVAGMGFAKALECGNIIMGRTTYQMFAPMMKDVLKNLEVVVISSEDMDSDVYTSKNAGLADELFFNLFPVVINGGGSMETAQGKVLEYRLAEAKSHGDIAMLHYIKK